jgi:hypothetical protein
VGDVAEDPLKRFLVSHSDFLLTVAHADIPELIKDGTGKSTIARTVADKYSVQKRLGASFFFSRDSEDVNHAGEFFATIAARFVSVVTMRLVPGASPGPQYRPRRVRPITRWYLRT